MSASRASAPGGIQGRTCKTFSMDSAGMGDHPGLQAWVKNRPWMPPGAEALDTDLTAWQRDHGEAIQTIKTCCANHDAPGCTWKAH